MERKPDASSFFDRVYVVVKLIPKGKVATYGQVAAILEHPRAARTVGWALHGLPERLAARVPWQRVINAEGRISNTGNFEEQLRRLKNEGIKFDKTGHCELRKYLWEPPAGLRLPVDPPRVLGGGGTAVRKSMPRAARRARAEDAVLSPHHVR